MRRYPDAERGGVGGGLGTGGRRFYHARQWPSFSCSRSTGAVASYPGSGGGLRAQIVQQSPTLTQDLELISIPRPRKERTTGESRDRSAKWFQIHKDPVEASTGLAVRKRKLHFPSLPSPSVYPSDVLIQLSVGTF